MTRGGEPIAAPAWFTAGWPAVPMDGEIWTWRGQFSQAVSTVRQKTPDNAAWRKLQFMVYDLKAQGGTFTQRIPPLEKLIIQINQPWVKAVVPFRVADHPALQRVLTKTVKNGGEGLMLHRGASLYKGLRSDDLLKVKRHEDTEARIVDYVPGKGKHDGKLGALLVEMPPMNGNPAQRFKLGTGFSNADRQRSPAIDSMVTYWFSCLNDSGVTRFASFIRKREDALN